MCTVSWRVAEGGLWVCFNRDEQRTRPPALPPSRWLPGVLAPRDPVGGGTWIAADCRGQVFCLLNHYQSANQPDQPLSRGTLIPALTQWSGPSPDALLTTLDLASYPGFHLLVFCREGLIMHRVWDGQALESLEHLDQRLGMWTTSGWNPDHVLAFRRAQWEQRRPEPRAQEGFHWYHHATDPRCGPLMVREDASTVSITTIHVLPSQIEMTYTPVHDATPGSPVTCHLHV